MSSVKPNVPAGSAPTSTVQRPERFRTISGTSIEPVYGPEHVAALDYDRDLNDPGQFPYTRGIHPSGDVAVIGAHVAHLARVCA